MYSYNLNQLRTLQAKITKKDWEQAFYYIGYHGIDLEYEVTKVLELGLLEYLVKHTTTAKEIEDMDFAINYLCKLYDINDFKISS